MEETFCIDRWNVQVVGFRELARMFPGKHWRPQILKVTWRPS